MRLLKRLNLLDWVIITGICIIIFALCMGIFTPKKEGRIFTQNMPMKLYIGDYYIEAEIRNVIDNSNI